MVDEIATSGRETDELLTVARPEQNHSRRPRSEYKFLFAYNQLNSTNHSALLEALSQYLVSIS